MQTANLMPRQSYDFGMDIPAQTAEWAVRGPMGMIENQHAERKAAVRAAVEKSRAGEVAVVTKLQTVLGEPITFVEKIYRNGVESFH